MTPHCNLRSAAPGRPNRLRHAVWIFGAFAVILLSLSFTAYRYFTRVQGMPRLSFDSAVWKANPATLPKPAGATRQRMVDDLLWDHPLIGLSRAEVEALIGAADVTPYFRGYDMVYYLGPDRGFIAIDSEWLVIKFDGAGRVSEARLVTD